MEITYWTLHFRITLVMSLTAPVLDDCLQHGSTAVLGPVWVSRGERFSPTGVREFLTGLIAYTKSKLKEAKRYQKQVSALISLLKRKQKLAHFDKVMALKKVWGGL